MESKLIAEALVSSAWANQLELGMTQAEVATWDARLVRKPRVLVPVDVQALYVPRGSSERFVELPFALANTDDTLAPMPEPFAEGAPRAPGVHLHWAAPDALMKGSIDRVADGARNRLRMPALPDRWVVLRIVAPRGRTAPSVRGWVIDAAEAKVVPLEQYPHGLSAAASTGRSLGPAELTATVGGSVSWTGVYDAAKNRLGFHDTLEDLTTVAPSGVQAGLASYVVAGFWSDPELDPLDSAETKASLHTRLNELGWSLAEDAEGGDQLEFQYTTKKQAQNQLGLPGGDRYVTQPKMEASAASQQPASIVYQPGINAFVDEAASVRHVETRWPRQTLLHGVVYGVPVEGPVVHDQRPGTAQLELALANHTEDLAATLGSAGLATTLDDRRDVERIVLAFSGQLLSRLGSADGLVDIEQYEHSAGFSSLPGGDGGVERLRAAGDTASLPAGRTARAAEAKRKLERKANKPGTRKAEAAVEWSGKKRSDLIASEKGGTARLLVESWRKREASRGRSGAERPAPEPRTVRRPAPRFFVPLDPQLAVRGPKRNLRHHGDGRFSPDGLLPCRWPSQVPTEVEGVLDGKQLVRSLPSGGIPSEVLQLVQNAVIQDPYLVPWLVDAAARERAGTNKQAAETRLLAEAALRFGDNGVYDGGSRAFIGRGKERILEVELADELRRFSLVPGMDCDPVGVTAWSQPWVPLFLEWEVAHTTSDRFEGWTLGAVDLEPPIADDAGELDDPALTAQVFSGRSPLHTGTAQTLAGAIDQWLVAEEQRDTTSTGEADEATERSLTRVADAIEHLDILTASLDGLRDRLLGLPVGDYGVLRARNADNSLALPTPAGPPQLIARGALAVLRARLVDAFGRTLDLPVERLRVPARETIEAAPRQLRCRPRLLRPARWLLRLVDPGDLTASAPEATLDQVDPSATVNPVAGFLLPDHIDEALELFDTQGTPLGQLMLEPFGGGVTWEIAPGREGPADAGPLHGLGSAQALLGLFATGLVAADATARQGLPADPTRESALSALLRAVDTTLWSVDTFVGFGSEHIAGLVGRPIAVVRALLRLEIDDDLDELDLSATERRSEREAAFRALADRKFPIRLGELTRADDGLLGFFVDDDFSRFHVVDKAVRDGALESGKGKGDFASLDDVTDVPAERSILHPYVVADDELHLHPGQTVRLTLLMHPAGKVHLTSGILPRKSIALARDWVDPGLAVIAPSARIGPVLVGPGKVRLPKISAFPKDQLWTRRTGPYTWKDDPILAATQTALLPDMPAEVQEGYIRIGVVAEEDEGASE